MGSPAVPINASDLRDDPRILSGIKHIKLECCLATAEPGWHLRK